MRVRSVVATTPDKQQVLIDLFEDGTVHISWRETTDTKQRWMPLDLAGGEWRVEA